MKKIWLIDPQSYRGLAKYDVQFLQALIDAGPACEITFFCSIHLDVEVPQSVLVKKLYQYNKARNPFWKLFSYVCSSIRLVIAALKEKPDIIHFQWLRVPAADWIVVFILRYSVGAAVILTAHNVVPHGKEAKKNLWTGRLYRIVDAIVVHGEDTKREIGERFKIESRRISVQNHGVITLKDAGVPQYEELVRNFVSQFDICFLFFGHGARYKGLDLLLEAWRAAFDQIANGVGLIIMGRIDQDLRDYVHARAAEDQSILLIDHYVSEADLYRCVMAVDVVVLPHREISASGVLLSVLGLGVPVLVANRPGLVAPLKFGKVGWVFDGSVEDLIRHLQRLKYHKAEIWRTKNDTAEFRQVCDAYDWRHVGEQTLAVYQQVLSQPQLERSNHTRDGSSD